MDCSIFLDVDGVLNSDEWHRRNRGLVHPSDYLDSAALRVLDDLIRLSGAQVVISSTWRLHYSLTELRGLFFEHGLSRPACRHIVAATPPKGLTRGDEIHQYVVEHALTYQAYVILDDDYRLAPHLDHAVLINPRWGLQGYHIDMAMPHLMGRYLCKERAAAMAKL